MQKLLLALAASSAAALVAPKALPRLRAPAAKSSMRMELIEPDKDFLIAPSILSADFARLGEEVVNSLSAGATPALRKHGVTAPIDVHLMVSPVDRIVGDFADAGASYITFHPEASPHVDRTLQLIRGAGCKAGLVFNPATPLDILKYVMDKVDIILLMSVNPGFGGQSFIPATLDKAREARKLIDASGYDIRLEIDGGVSGANIKEVAEAGVDMFVAGSAIFRDPRTEEDYKVTIDAMRDELAAAKVPANLVES
ncbi:ribulose-phosphate 3-epimerase [Aureococcus anophagefferens]|nr:ribulose-phosphate 3-epimerase [Aureococcus anophagefferens]